MSIPRHQMSDEYLCQLLDTNPLIALQMINVSAVVVEKLVEIQSSGKNRILAKKFVTILDQWSRTGKDCAKIYIKLRFPEVGIRVNIK